ncbi:MAG: N-acetylglucosamine-6-phosphate deacetylase [Parahaliea sp.]
MKQALLTSRLFDGEVFLEDQAVLLADDKIQALIPHHEIPVDYTHRVVIDGLLAPGLIDIQVNGGGGLLFNDQPDPAALQCISEAHRAAGTTSLVPTLISDQANIHRAGVAAAIASRAAGNAAILGIHLEGPFLAPARRGVHSAQAIRSPQASDIDWLCQCSSRLPTIITLAPEQLPTQAIARLNKAGALLCAGHTEATYEQICTAIDNGLRGFTHLFNAMNPLTARSPGTVGAALTSDCWVGIIADGHHVHPANLKIALRTIPHQRLLLVSDSMSTIGSRQTHFELYGKPVRLSEDKLQTEDGILAGSAIALMDAVRYCHQHLHVSLDECLRMAALYPANFLGLEQKLGRIRKGFQADLVHFDTNFQVFDTWLAGQHRQHTKP